MENGIRAGNLVGPSMGAEVTSDVTSSGPGQWTREDLMEIIQSPPFRQHAYKVESIFPRIRFQRRDTSSVEDRFDNSSEIRR
ncbi:hypothetical protein LguiA_025682 [Lonicera macranthoides]